MAEVEREPGEDDVAPSERWQAINARLADYDSLSAQLPTLALTELWEALINWRSDRNFVATQAQLLTAAGKEIEGIKLQGDYGYALSDVCSVIETRIKQRRNEDLRAKGNGGEPGKQVEFWPAPLSMKEFLNRPMDKTRWLWDRAVAFGSTSLVVAKPRDGKSTFACNLALAIARGIPFLGRETVKASAFYLSLDNSAEDLAAIIEPLGISERDDMFVHAGAIPQNSLEWLREMIEKLSLKFVVVDTLQRFFHIENVNDYAETVNAMGPLDNLAKELGFHVMYVHHAGKHSAETLDASLGSTALKGMCPSYFHIVRIGELKQRIMTSDFRNGKNFESIAIKLDRMTGWIMAAGTLEDAQITEAMPKVLEVLRFMTEGITETELRKNIAMKGIIVSKAMREMFKASEIERTGAGKRGDPFRYYLAGRLQPAEPKDDELF